MIPLFLFFSHVSFSSLKLLGSLFCSVHSEVLPQYLLKMFIRYNLVKIFQMKTKFSQFWFSHDTFDFSLHCFQSSWNTYLSDMGHTWLSHSFITFSLCISFFSNGISLIVSPIPFTEFYFVGNTFLISKISHCFPIIPLV